MSETVDSDDVDLTNLNWVAGAPVPLPANFSVSPPEHKSPTVRNRSSPFTPFRGCGPTSTTSSPGSHDHSRPVEIVVTSPWRKESVATSQTHSMLQGSNPTTPLRFSYDKNEIEYQKPNCSYTCLIGMALRASPGTDGCLPVNEIYKYVEKEFPYFKTAPDGWKNSVRHNLSLNPSFRKVTRNDGWQGKKGFFWEIAPEKKEIVNSEVDTFLKSTGRELQPHSTLLTSPIQPTIKQYTLPVPRQSTPCKVRKVTPRKSPPDVAYYSPQIQNQIAASPMQLNPKLSPTEREFDMDNTPSEYVGIEAPSTDLNESARELFGLDTTPVSKNQPPQEQYNVSGSSDGPLFPLYTPVSPYYGALYGYPVPIGSSSPSPLVGISPPSPFLPQYLPPQYVQYVHNDNMTGVIYGAPMIGNQMMFGMGYNVPRVVDGKVIEAEDLEKCDGEVHVEELRCTENHNTARVQQKKAPSTPTSHYASGNGHVPKRLRLNDYQENNTVPPVQLTETKGCEVDVDAIFQELLRQSRKTSVEDDGLFEGGSTVKIDGLSNHEKDHLQQIAGVFDLETLLRSGIGSLGTSSSTTGEKTATDCVQSSSEGSTRSFVVPHTHGLLHLGAHNNKTMHDLQEEVNQESGISPESPLVAEEIIVETYQG